ncbi:hypothetical protein N473_06935 [Pseudoalteromonas luteoviolacea CPMOR-1]|uniref:Uncharacterized protein n=1 Tax=Pseudoalteromonas luteoviolacea CPMOR-1 TaxID=1365248 RepID=A0A161YCH6_9GAMM|nr:helix-turn-helix domain-containing protein [Pseudoalteromonas luteoviolacea]KZN57606.1 hypothetical protein N473_06935 [Pseudoalteromonas luteoviolacea CPMOR-1]
MSRNPNSIFKVASAIYLLTVPTYFGVCNQTAEMGLAIAIGFLGLTFANLDKFKHFKAPGVEALLKSEQIQAVLDKETEVIKDDKEVSGQQVDVHTIPIDVQAIVKALRHHKYTWRYASGIAEDTNMKRTTVSRYLNWLLEHHYVKKSFGDNGPIWALTNSGLYLYAKINPKDDEKAQH